MPLIVKTTQKNYLFINKLLHNSIGNALFTKIDEIPYEIIEIVNVDSCTYCENDLFITRCAALAIPSRKIAMNQIMYSFPFMLQFQYHLISTVVTQSIGKCWYIVHVNIKL